MYICIYGYQMLGRQCYQVGLLLSVMLCVTAYLYISSFSHSCLSLRDALLFLSLLVVTQIRGHAAGSSAPSSLRFVPCILIARRCQICLSSSTRVELCLSTLGVDPLLFL